MLHRWIKPVVSYKQCNKDSPVGSYNIVLHKCLPVALRDKYTVTYKFKHNATVSNVVGCNQIFLSRSGMSPTVNLCCRCSFKPSSHRSK